ncbi:rhamnosyltransferase [Actinobaculum suis]|uniref:Glycosyltransferase family 2 protein n=1 Tax=Actinobaculum suis TaxID=1657 RepID=A0A1G7DMH1_9ACTO|nr:glycosyltransferase family 2 protein [Actinobaculum suis]MDY5153524.1 glycosyltransferase family 2 protein [Actinobaculum suis]SDE52727.1 rhamnosyltransferase [Actinobaculum suis]
MGTQFADREVTHPEAAGQEVTDQDVAGRETPRVVAVVVTYNPPALSALLEALSAQVAAVVVVDNGSASATVRELSALCARAGADFLATGTNLGIAAAQNLGISRARELEATHILLSDHDSVPAPDMVSLLLAGLETDPRIGAAGPLPAEDRAGADQLVYVARRWAPKRAYPEELAQEILDVAFLVASGCLIRVECLDDVGDMNTAMFIDHVDLEWGLRAHARKWRLICVPAAHLHHSLGDEVVMLPGRAQPVHVHSPMRNYYIVRNTLDLVRHGRALMPTRWRIRYTWWAGKYVAFNGFLIDRGSERRRELFAGIRDAVRGRRGRRGIS